MGGYFQTNRGILGLEIFLVIAKYTSMALKSRRYGFQRYLQTNKQSERINSDSTDKLFSLTKRCKSETTVNMMKLSSFLRSLPFNSVFPKFNIFSH